MRKGLVISLILCCLVACSPGEKGLSRMADSPHTTQWQDSATVEVSCDSQDVPVGESTASVLQDQGVIRGVQEIFNIWQPTD